MFQRTRLHCESCKNKIIQFLLPWLTKENDSIWQCDALTKITQQPCWARQKICSAQFLILDKWWLLFQNKYENSTNKWQFQCTGLIFRILKLRDFLGPSLYLCCYLCLYQQQLMDFFFPMNYLFRGWNQMTITIPTYV